MNGFTNVILSVLLGWLRSLFNSVWQLFGSESGGSFIQFLSHNWKLLAIILIVGGFVLDRLVFFARWRPDFVWRSNLHRMRRGSTADEPEQPERQQNAYDAYRRPDVEQPEEGVYPDPGHPDDAYDASAYAMPGEEPMQTNVFAPARQSPSHLAYAAPAMQYQPAPSDSDVYAPAYRAAPADTNAYAPVYQPPMGDDHASSVAYDVPGAPVSTFAPPASYARTYTPPAAIDPMTEDARFDEPIAWSAPTDEPTRVGNPLFAPSVAPLTHNPAQDMTPIFGAPQPEPTAYLQDVQAGFAPPPTPEELYRRRSEPLLRDPEPPRSEPVHPGLDPAVLQQNIGLTGKEELTSVSDEYTDFVPFTVANDSGEEAPKVANPFSLLAKRARSLVGGMDEEQLSIHDLQSTVDVKSAFHSPVYPKKKPESEDE